MLKRLSILASFAVLITATAAGFGCGDGDDGNQASTDPAAMEVEQTVRQAVEAFNRGDATTFLSYWTDKGIEEEFEASRAEIMAAADDFFGGPPRMLRALENTKVRGDKATTEAEFTLAKSIEREELELARQGNTWKIDATDPLQVKVPSGTKAVDVDLSEFAFEYKPDEITNGNIAFEANNKGKQAHELIVLKVPESFELLRALRSPEMPAGVELIGGMAPKAAGEKANLVFTEPLSAGRYIMVCFLPDTNDPQGTPHIAKGMVSEFAIQAQGGNR